MQILVDTGILLRAFDRTSSHQRPILRTFQTIWNRGDEMVATHQNIAEFWNVATRPASSLNHNIVGVAVHDARLVATMLRFGITNILTLNGADFQRYPNIVSSTPYDFA